MLRASSILSSMYVNIFYIFLYKVSQISSTKNLLEYSMNKNKKKMSYKHVYVNA